MHNLSLHVSGVSTSHHHHELHRVDTAIGTYCSYCTYWVEPSQVGTAIAQWLRCCATNRKVAGWIKPGVIGIFH